MQSARNPGRVMVRLAAAVLLLLVALFLLQFALQAVFNSPPQAVLTFVATAGFAVAAYRVYRHQRIAGLVFVTTLPLFLFSLAGSLLYPDESPIYAAVSAMAPAVAGASWLARRRVGHGGTIGGTA